MNEAAFRDLISGKRKGFIAALCRWGLKGLAFFYGVGVRTRNFLFEMRIRRTHAAAVPVISVGNLTTGGTGKTPFVAFLANWFRSRGVRVVLLSRGYRALADKPNDEKLVLELLCPGVPHVQNPDRVAGAQIACREHQAQLIILDDGFQHRRLQRSLDIVLVDALCPWGYGSLLPRGLLREPLSGLERADLVVVTRVADCSVNEKQQIHTRIAAERKTDELIEVAYPAIQLVNSVGERAGFESLQNQPLAAFCGIGNPDGFRRTIDRCGLSVADAAFRAFEDHHHYTREDLNQMAELAKQTGARALLTTQKDLVKINQTHLGEIPLWSVEIGTEILAGGELLSASLEELAELAALIPE